MQGFVVLSVSGCQYWRFILQDHRAAAALSLSLAPTLVTPRASMDPSSRKGSREGVTWGKAQYMHPQWQYILRVFNRSTLSRAGCH
jgi:hypothetical protein